VQTLQGAFNGTGDYKFYGMIEYKEDNRSKKSAY
jgi:hypothetical protein